jgi:hypothetical protein
MIWNRIATCRNYEASDGGEVRSIDHMVECPTKNGGVCLHRIAGRILKPWINKWGYLDVTVWHDGSRTARCVHTLVYEAFNGPIPPVLDVDHIDRNTINNKLDNLRLITRIGNSLNRSASGASWHKAVGKWHSRVQYNGKAVSLGYYDNKSDAECASATERARLLQLELEKAAQIARVFIGANNA